MHLTTNFTERDFFSSEYESRVFERPVNTLLTPTRSLITRKRELFRLLSYRYVCVLQTHSLLHGFNYKLQQFNTMLHLSIYGFFVTASSCARTKMKTRSFLLSTKKFVKLKNFICCACVYLLSYFKKITFYPSLFLSLQAEKKGLVMVNFFSYFLTCSNHSTIRDVIGKEIWGKWRVAGRWF